MNAVYLFAQLLWPWNRFAPGQNRHLDDIAQIADDCIFFDHPFLPEDLFEDIAFVVT
jgi:hypothetical protein